MHIAIHQEAGKQYLMRNERYVASARRNRTVETRSAELRRITAIKTSSNNNENNNSRRQKKKKRKANHTGGSKRAGQHFSCAFTTKALPPTSCPSHNKGPQELKTCVGV